MMKKLVISMVIEGEESDLHEIKGNIIKQASDALLSMHVNEIDEQPKKLDLSMLALINNR